MLPPISQRERMAIISDTVRRGSSINFSVIKKSSTTAVNCMYFIQLPISRHKVTFFLTKQ